MLITTLVFFMFSAVISAGSLSGSVVAFNVAIASSSTFHRWQRAFNVAKDMENLQAGRWKEKAQLRWLENTI
jgi:hypothetical protein